MATKASMQYAAIYAVYAAICSMQLICSICSYMQYAANMQYMQLYAVCSYIYAVYAAICSMQLICSIYRSHLRTCTCTCGLCNGCAEYCGVGNGMESVGMRSFRVA